jgi:prepilin-type N-terminal cleavage/methylation domain-containing protein
MGRAVRSQAGFTLTELLVVCALLGLVMAGLLALVMSGLQAYVWGANQADAQQNARVALERMIREIREAGYHPAPPTCPAPPCPPGFVYQFDAITGQSATGLTLQYDWNGVSGSQPGITVTDPINGLVRGERVTYSFSGSNLMRQESGVDASPVVVASGISLLSFGYLDQNDSPTSVAANIRTVTVTLTTATGGGAYATMAHRVRLRNR